MDSETTEIRGGVEWFKTPDGGDDCQCARCGSSAEWVACANCGGEGVSHHDCGEDCCCCPDPEPNVVCDWCLGNGGGWHCVSSPEYCETNPLPGREHVPSTAMRAEAWNDAY